MEDIRKGRVTSSEATNTTALQKERIKDLEGMHIMGCIYYHLSYDSSLPFFVSSDITIIIPIQLLVLMPSRIKVLKHLAG